MRSNGAALLRQWGGYAAWLVALVATLGSLYLSEVAGFIPCTLCWYQRIFMYPLAAILGVASYRGDRPAAYVLALSVPGLAVALFHYADQKLPGSAAAGICSGQIPCTSEYINWLGFVTIPLMSAAAFFLITLFTIGHYRMRPGQATRTPKS